MIKLPPDIKREWIAALRGGEFKQAREALRTDTGRESGYCCLGVMAEVLDPGVLRNDYGEEFMDEELLTNEPWCTAHGIRKVLEQPVTDTWDWAGFERGPELHARHLRIAGRPWMVQSALVAMNDEGHCTFEEIADVIERNL
jgi:hypothetical protein